MYDRYFKILRGTYLHKRLHYCMKENHKFAKVMHEFLVEHGFESKVCYIAGRLIVRTTEADREKFKKQLKRDGKTFKKRSELNQLYIKALDENKIDLLAAKGINLWDIGAYVNSSCTFKHFWLRENDTFYLCIDTEKEEAYNVSKDVIEIKGSEYHLALEAKNTAEKEG